MLLATLTGHEDYKPKPNACTAQHAASWCYVGYWLWALAYLAFFAKLNLLHPLPVSRLSSRDQQLTWRVGERECSSQPLFWDLWVGGSSQPLEADSSYRLHPPLLPLLLLSYLHFRKTSRPRPHMHAQLIVASRMRINHAQTHHKKRMHFLPLLQM